MTPELAKYIAALPDDRAIRLWLTAIGQAATNGTANIIYRDMMLAFRLDLKQIKNLFDPTEAEKLELVKILACTDNFISLNFKARVTAVKLKRKEQKALAEYNPNPKPEKSSEIVPTAITPAAAKPQVDENGLILPPLPQKYSPSGKLQRCIIGDYIGFYKHMVKSKAALVGSTIEDPVAPHISTYDAKCFKQIALHLAGNEKVSNMGERGIRLALLRIYQEWHRMPPNVENYHSPGQILRNWNTIYLLMTTKFNNGKHTTNKKDAELTEKINRTEQRDYSYMVRT